MRLPFGLDLVSVLVGVVFAVWVLPMLLGFFSRARTSE
jgi:hypothetical protein